MQLKDAKEHQRLSHQRLLIKNAEQKLTKTQKPYLKLLLVDPTNELAANLWDVTAEQIATYQAGTVVLIDGEITSFNSKLQININQINVADNQSLEDLIPTIPEDYQTVKGDLIRYTEEITDPIYSLIVRTLLSKHDHEFLKWPAAVTVHHNFYHGLLFHTVSILRQLDHFSHQYPQLDRQLMFAGAILHDMGKTLELSGILNTQYTTMGQLIGHISIIDGEINRIAEANNIPADNYHLLLLRHMVLSHHGKLEYGSPVEPRVLEAVLLHQADETDAQINTITKVLNHTDPQAWSEKLWTQNNHSFLNHQEETHEQENL